MQAKSLLACTCIVGAGRPHSRMRANPAKWAAQRAAGWNSAGGERRGKTHPAHADLTSAPGGITLGWEEGERDAVFTCLGVSLKVFCLLA
jgi:hypothetical protein